MNMTQENLKAYEKYVINLARDRDVVETAKEEGLEEGLYMTAKNAIVEGLSNEIIKKITKFTDEQINDLRNEMNDNAML